MTTTASYYDKQSASAALGEELESRGWKLYGYKENQSDSMTDYYSPAYWHGVATHPARAGVVVVVWETEGKNSGVEVRKHLSVKVDNCARCGGSGNDPDLAHWTLETARQSPREFNAELCKAEGGGGMMLFADVVSPIHFLGGAVKCQKCHGMTGKFSSVDNGLDYIWPKYTGNKKGEFYHIEKGGRIIATGRGFNIGINREKEGAREIADKIESACTSKTSEPTPPTSADAGGYSVEYEREWTWIRFATKPNQSVLDSLKGAGARFSGKRVAWYFTRHIEALEVAVMIDSQLVSA